MDINISISGPDIPDNADELYAIEAYKAVDKIYSGKQLEGVKKGMTQQGNTITVNGLLSKKLFVGQEPYSLKKALTTSTRVTQSSLTGEKQLKVPINGKVVTMTEHSRGWEHPGFSNEYFNKFIEFVQSYEMEQLLLNLFLE